MKQLNIDLENDGETWIFQLHESKEFRREANVVAYKERTKQWHDKNNQQKVFKVGQQVLKYNFRLKLFPRKTPWYHYSRMIVA